MSELSDGAKVFEQARKVLRQEMLAKSQCWFWHDWSKWKVTERGNITSGPRTVGRYFVQERNCLRCGRTQGQMVREE